MKATKSCGDVISISDGVNNNGFEVYGSVRDVYEKLYQKTMDYSTEQDAERKREIAREISVLEKSLSCLAKSSGAAATILEEHHRSRKLEILLPAATAFLVALWLLMSIL